MAVSPTGQAEQYWLQDWSLALIRVAVWIKIYIVYLAGSKEYVYTHTQICTSLVYYITHYQLINKPRT